MFDSLIDLDVDLLIFLNNLGSNRWDSFWIYITHQEHWIPFFVLLLLFIYLQVGLKKTLFTILVIAVLIALTNGFTDFVKNSVERLRPCNVKALQDQIRHFTTIYNPQSYSFFSGHSSNSAALATFMILLFRKQNKWIYLILVFPLIFAYSRIYLGFHFPLDIVIGFSAGILTGTLVYKMFNYYLNKMYFS